jgi:hypothetical protein
LSGCHDNDTTIDRLNYIKTVGDTNPTEALAMLDSINTEIRGESEYIQKKYDLLNIRLKDKAHIVATSDITIKQLILYFEANGNGQEKQETYYYAGSVYRDLQDMPRALDNFYTSISYAVELGDECDSLLLRNSYSNICFIQHKVQDYGKALYYAKKEYELSEKLHENMAIDIMHIGVSYLYLDSLTEAKKWFDKAFGCISEKDTTTNREIIYNLICSYSSIGDTIMADKCYSVIQSLSNETYSNSNLENLNLGTYFEFINQTDSAISCFKRIIDDGSDNFAVYDASKHLFLLYRKMGDDKNAIHYMDIYSRTCDTLDLGKRQELAATVNNQFQYHLDKNAEIKMIEKTQKQQKRNIIIASLALTAVLLSLVFIVIKKNRHLKEMVALNRKLKSARKETDTLRNDIEAKNMELTQIIEEKEQAIKDTENAEIELQYVLFQLQEQEKELEKHKLKLAENIEQNKLFLRLIQQTEFEGKAEDVIMALKQSSTGRKNMTFAEWKELYKAVDEMYPDFKNQLIAKLGKFTAQQMQVCYLIRIGLDKPEIQNLTNLSRVTVWRWFKKYSWILTPDDIKKR